MTDPTIPPTVLKAAKRGFIRTTAQAYSTALAGGISSAAIITVLQNGPGDWTALAVTAGVTLVSPLLAGTASFLSILASGVPADYLNAE
jgi:hypothetical protein